MRSEKEIRKSMKANWKGFQKYKDSKKIEEKQDARLYLQSYCELAWVLEAK